MKCSLTFTGCEHIAVGEPEYRATGYTSRRYPYGFCAHCQRLLRKWNKRRLVEPRHYGTSLANAIWPDTSGLMSDARRLEDAKRYRARKWKRHYAEVEKAV